MSPSTGDYGLGGGQPDGALQIPDLQSGPPAIKGSAPGIGLIGCGGISESHLAAYKRLGFDVLALCSRDLADAKARAAQFFPNALVTESHNELLGVDGIGIVDIATHPEGRGALISDALRSGRSVMSQKPFVLDLEEGQGLVDLAEACGVLLAVNQNGRWAPHLAGMRSAVQRGLVGEMEEVDISIRWDHSWTVGTPFDQTQHLVLFDFAIHWFDFIECLLGGREIDEVSASVSHSPGQASPQPMRAEVYMTGEGVRVRMSFDGDCQLFQRDRTYIKGSEGVLVSAGQDLLNQELRLYRKEGSGEVPLEGDWFTTGFEGAMAELMVSIQGEREPIHSAQGNLRSLELAFAACESAQAGVAVKPGSVRSLPRSH